MVFATSTNIPIFFELRLPSVNRRLRFPPVLNTAPTSTHVILEGLEEPVDALGKRRVSECLKKGNVMLDVIVCWKQRSPNFKRIQLCL